MPNDHRSARFHASTSDGVLLTRSSLRLICGLRCHQSHHDGRHLFSSTFKHEQRASKQERCPSRRNPSENEAIAGDRGGGCGSVCMWKKSGNSAAPMIMIHHSCLSMRWTDRRPMATTIWRRLGLGPRGGCGRTRWRRVPCRMGGR